MIRILSHTQLQDEKVFLVAFANSSDAKPTNYEGKTLAQGCIFYEVNTGNAYMYDETSGWILQ